MTERFLSDNYQNMNMLDIEEPSPITTIHMDKSLMELVVVGHHWSPKREPADTADKPEDLDIDEILEINYEWSFFEYNNTLSIITIISR